VSRLVVVDSDLLALALARELASHGLAVTVRLTPDDPSTTGEHADLRMLAAEPTTVLREAGARDAWRALETETGVAILGRLDALDVGPETTVADVLLATGHAHPARVLYPVEAARCWPQVRFDGLVAHQPAARRVRLGDAQRALVRSARRRGVRFDAAGRADVEVRSERAARISSADRHTELLVGSIAPPGAWPSVVHHRGLPPHPDGHRLAGARATARGDAVRLALLDAVAADADPATQLWEYAVRWLPGTIVSRPRRHVSPPAPEPGLIPVQAAELAAAVAAGVDHETERAS
jgi:hypothetical protein